MNSPDVTRQSMFLKAEAILAYLLGINDKIDTMVTCKPAGIELVTTDQELYEALGSMDIDERYNQRKLVKLLENVTMMPHAQMHRDRRTILTDGRVKELRSKVDRGEKR